MKKLFLSVCVCLIAATSVYASEVKYRRSSIYSIMALNPEFAASTEKAAAKAQVEKSFLAAPVPDKYDDHNLGQRVIDLNAITVTPEEIAAMENQSGKKKKKIGKLASSAASEATGGVVGGIDENEVAAKLQKWLNENHIANQLVGKWYNESTVDKDGSFFNYDLISERGLYDASAQEAAAAEETLGGLNKIMDAASMELIPNTFVMVSVFNYLSAEEIAEILGQAANKAGKLAGGRAGALTSVAGAATSAAASAMKGYFVRTNTFLFQLEWTKELQDKFETTYWKATDLTEFHNSADFKLKYVGKTSDFTPASLKISLNPDEDAKAIDRATVRAIDGAVEKLQKEYDVFKTLSPIMIQDGKVTAYVGMKEGIEGGDKFDVIELIMKEDGTTEMKKVGSVKAEKGKIWDNRYKAGEKIEGVASDGKEDDAAAASLQFTTFDGKASKFMDGMMIRQTK